MEDKEWHKLAEQLNTESFISAFHREPQNYNEVLLWVYEIVATIPKTSISQTLLDQYDSLGVPHDDKGVLLHGEIEL